MLDTAWKWVEHNPEWVAIFVYTLIECFIGKSKKLESNSTLELIWNILRRRKP